MNFFNLSFLDPIRSLRCQPSCVNDWALKFKILRQIFHFLSFIENLKVLTKDIISPVKLQFVLRGRIWLFYRFFFTIYIPFAFLSQFWVFSNKRWCYSACKIPIVMVSTMGRQYKKTFNPISNLWAIFKILKLRFPHYIVLFVVLFTADTHTKKKMGRAQ